MLRLLLVFCILLLFGTGCSVSQSPIKTIDQVERQSVALLETTNDPAKPYQIYCGAVWIGPTKLLTARHCITDVIKGDLHYLLGVKPDWQQLPGNFIPFVNYNDDLKSYHWAMIVAYDSTNDLALLEVVDGQHSFAPLTKSNGVRGEEIHIIGHTQRLPFNYFPGIVSAPSRDMSSYFEGEPTIVMHITAPIGPGNSGGGAFNEGGELIGICSFISTSIPMASFFVGPREIRKFLHDNQVEPGR